MKVGGKESKSINIQVNFWTSTYINARTPVGDNQMKGVTAEGNVVRQEDSR